MKDDIHELIDGHLPDDQAAETLHSLSVDPEKRADFRSQLSLQRKLYQNEKHAGLSSLEEGEMLDRVMRTSGGAVGSTGRVIRRGVMMLAAGFLIGSGAGYAGHAMLSDSETAAPQEVSTVPVVQEMQPQHVENLNRDSIVAAIRDSLRLEQNKVSAVAPGRKASKVSPKRPTRSTSTNDLTGSPEVRKRNRRR